ncbi:MAG: TrbC/VirB2 family protein [Sphingobium sp.]
MTVALASAFQPGSRLRAVLSSPYFWMALAVVVLLLCSIDAAYAKTEEAGVDLPWEDPLEKIRSSISGPVAFAIALLGIIACGATLIWGGEVSEFTRRIIYVVLVVCIIVFANTFLTSTIGATVPADAHVTAADLAAYAQAKTAHAGSLVGAGVQ